MAFRPKLMNIGEGETVEIPRPIPMSVPKKLPKETPFPAGVPIRVPERVPVKVGSGRQEPMKYFPEQGMVGTCPFCGKEMEEVEGEDGTEMLTCPKGCFSYVTQ